MALNDFALPIAECLGRCPGAASHCELLGIDVQLVGDTTGHTTSTITTATTGWSSQLSAHI